MGFFQEGREFEGSTVTHHYTAEEIKQMNKFESLDYFLPTNKVYMVNSIHFRNSTFYNSHPICRHTFDKIQHLLIKLINGS